MKGGDILKQVLLFVMLGAIIQTMTTIGIVGAGSQNKNEMSSQIRVITGINIVLVFVMAVLAYLQIRAEPLNERPQVLIMLHVNFFLSLLAVSISTLQKLNA